MPILYQSSKSIPNIVKILFKSSVELKSIDKWPLPFLLSEIETGLPNFVESTFTCSNKSRLSYLITLRNFISFLHSLH